MVSIYLCMYVHDIIRCVRLSPLKVIIFDVEVFQVILLYAPHTVHLVKCKQKVRFHFGWKLFIYGNMYWVLGCQMSIKLIRERWGGGGDRLFGEWQHASSKKDFHFTIQLYEAAFQNLALRTKKLIWIDQVNWILIILATGFYQALLSICYRWLH